MPSGRVAMSLPCRDLRREEAVGAPCREARTAGGTRMALCEDGRCAYPSDASISAVGGVAPGSETDPAPLATGRGEGALNDPSSPHFPSALLEGSVFCRCNELKRYFRLHDKYETCEARSLRCRLLLGKEINAQAIVWG